MRLFSLTLFASALVGASLMVAAFPRHTSAVQKPQMIETQLFNPSADALDAIDRALAGAAEHNRRVVAQLQDLCDCSDQLTMNDRLALRWWPSDNHH